MQEEDGHDYVVEIPGHESLGNVSLDVCVTRTAQMYNVTVILPTIVSDWKDVMTRHCGVVAAPRTFFNRSHHNLLPAQTPSRKASTTARVPSMITS